mmetsp:Transcript_126457/g.252670  ORF Transcript_126457/g.252670 Transcript_126457/m.252670 type:complete len:81 (-) Transcript_126457:130-372(-)
MVRGSLAIGFARIAHLAGLHAVAGDWNDPGKAFCTEVMFQAKKGEQQNQQCGLCYSLCLRPPFVSQQHSFASSSSVAWVA